VLHLVAVIIGFGGVFLAGMLGVEAKKRGGTDALAISRSTLAVTERVALMAIYAVPILGILLILTSDDAWKFSQAWISVSFLLYIVALGISHGVHQPNIKRMNVLMGELTSGAAAGGTGGRPPQVAELEERGKKAALFGGVLNLMWVVIVFLMVYKPGV
jgi:uncharacterized membrane protein